MAIPAFVGPMISAGGSILGAILGGGASRDAAAYNAAVNQANIAAAERSDLRGQIAARLARQREERGITDAAGNRVYYDPTRGWVTELSPDQQALQTGTTAAQQFNLGEGERLRQEGVTRGAEQQRGESQAANALMEEFVRRARTDPTALSEQIYAAGEIGRQDAQDRANAQTSRQLVRTGNTSNVANILASRAREGARASEEARRQAAIQAPDIAAQRDASRGANTANLYNMFAQRAANPSGVAFSPVSPTGPARPDTRGLTAGIVNLAGRRPVQYDYIQPNFGTANMLGTIGQTVGSGIQNYYASRRLDEMNQQLAETNRLLGNQG